MAAAPSAWRPRRRRRRRLFTSGPSPAGRLAVAVLPLMVGAALLCVVPASVHAARIGPPPSSSSSSSSSALLGVRRGHHDGRGRCWGVVEALRAVRGGATAAAAPAPPGFFTIAERFQALAVGSEEDQEGEEDNAALEAAVLGKRRGKGSHTSSSREEQALRAALQYSVVAIVGPQASGKSTLLNALFGTRFPVLDARTTGVQRTTRGVWVDLSSRPAATPSPHSSPPPLVVLDTEGLESVARGVEGSGLFDRQVSTLAVAAADVVLLNVWARDVRGGRLGGGEEGAGLHAELLRALVQTAAAAKEGDAGGAGRAVSLVVVLRDSEHRGGDLAAARDAVRRALAEAAEGLGLPPPSSSSSRAQKRRRPQQEQEERAGTGGDEDAKEEVLVVAGVSVAFAALPSKAFQPTEFAAAAETLRSRLVRSMMPAPSPSPSVRLQPVPLPRFPGFAKELWESIVAETGGVVGGESVQGRKGRADRNPKEQAQAVRAFVRRKAVESCCQEAEPAIAKLERKVDAATEMPILEFGRDAGAVLATAKRTLRARLSGNGKGEADVVAEAEREAVAALGRRLEPCFRQHVEALGDFYFGKFQDKFLGMYYPAPRLDKEATALVMDVVGAFDKAAAAAIPPEMVQASSSGGWAASAEATRARMRDEMDLEVADRRMEVEVLFPTPDELSAAQLGRRFFLRPAWWRKVLLKCVVVYVNYLQTVQAAQTLARAARRRQEQYPPVPLF